MPKDELLTRVPGAAHKRRGGILVVLVATAVFGMTTFPAEPAKADDNGLTVTDGWIRMIVPLRPAAGYFTIKNDGDKEQALTAASSPACGNVMLHQSKTVNGVDKMKMVKKVAVPAHGTLQFAPHGYHLMCMQPSADMKPGTEVPFTLSFESGATLTASFKVHGATD